MITVVKHILTERVGLAYSMVDCFYGRDLGNPGEVYSGFLHVGEHARSWLREPHSLILYFDEGVNSSGVPP